MRIGLVARKLGMTRIFTETGDHVPVTVLQVEDCQVVGVKTEEKNGYAAVQVAAFSAKPSSLRKPQRDFYAKIGFEPKKTLKEFRVSDVSQVELGQSVGVSHFQQGQFVDVTAVSIGKGFAGVIKRHNFRMNRASHGASVCHRSHGSTGQRQDPGRVFKGKKMAGHLGAERVTIQNLKVVSSDSERGLLYVKGAVPGCKGVTVVVKDAIKKS